MSALHLINIYIGTKFNFDLFGIFQDMARTDIHYRKLLRRDKSINIQGRVGLWFLGSALPLIAIYLQTKSHLKANSSFKVICRTRYWTDGWTDGKSGDYMLPPLGSINMCLHKHKTGIHVMGNINLEMPISLILCMVFRLYHLTY